jgi:hypothetical protein
MMPRRATALFLSLSFLTAACSMNRQTSESTANNQPGASPAASGQSQPPKSGEVASGEASGSFTSKGETVELKYAYASRGKRFNEDSVIVLVTDKPIPAESLAEEIADQTMMFDGKIRGLEYVFMKDGYWVRYHPGQYQESQSLNQLKSYSVENDVVKAEDESTSSMSDSNYSRSLKFTAALPKQ